MSTRRKPSAQTETTPDEVPGVAAVTPEVEVDVSAEVEVTAEAAPGTTAEVEVTAEAAPGTTAEVEVTAEAAPGTTAEVEVANGPTLMADPDGVERSIVPAGVAALLALGWTIV